jgi:hypothetical protein
MLIHKPDACIINYAESQVGLADSYQAYKIV